MGISLSNVLNTIRSFIEILKYIRIILIYLSKDYLKISKMNSMITCEIIIYSYAIQPHTHYVYIKSDFLWNLSTYSPIR